MGGMDYFPKRLPGQPLFRVGPSTSFGRSSIRFLF
jgi:hypothetical protein